MIYIIDDCFNPTILSFDLSFLSDPLIIFYKSLNIEEINPLLSQIKNNKGPHIVFLHQSLSIKNNGVPLVDTQNNNYISNIKVRIEESGTQIIIFGGAVSDDKNKKLIYRDHFYERFESFFKNYKDNDIFDIDLLYGEKAANVDRMMLIQSIMAKIRKTDSIKNLLEDDLFLKNIEKICGTNLDAISIINDWIQKNLSPKEIIAYINNTLVRL